MNEAEELLDLFIHPGWKRVMAEMEEAHDMLIKTAWHLKDPVEMAQRRGEILKLASFINYERAARMNIVEADHADAV